MIVRVLGDRQYELDDSVLPELEQLERRLDEAVSSGDESAYADALEAVHDKVQRAGRPLEPTDLLPSDLTVPHEGSSIADLTALLQSEPGSAPEGRE